MGPPIAHRRGKRYVPICSGESNVRCRPRSECSRNAGRVLNWRCDQQRRCCAARRRPGLWWTARSILVVISIAALLSIGAQVYFLRFLVPAQWLAARHSHRNGHVLFTLLAALLVTEVGWMIAYELTAESAVAIGLATGVVIGALFLRTSGRRF